MSLTTALFTGLTGMDVHTKSLDVIGNNITNVNTFGFKGSRALFQSQLTNNLSLGTAPDGVTGGTNPLSIGLGVSFSGTQRNFTNGSIQPTGVNTDLALEGNGFFILRQLDGPYYTRAGTFDLDAEKNLVSPEGGIVQGYGVDENFNIVPGILGDINIPLGTLTVAEATRNVDFAGNLNASGTLATVGSNTTTQALTDLGSAAAATAATTLTNLSSDGINPLFSAGDVITIQGAEKGGKSLGTFKFEVGAVNTTGADANGTTFDDLRAFVEDVLGINTSVEGAGVTIGASGELIIDGNFGTINDVNLQTADLFTNGAVQQPFIFTKNQDSVGESVRTSLAVYDSLGTPLTVDVSMSLVSKGTTGTQWRYYAESVDDTDVAVALGTGTLDFNTSGELIDVSNSQIQIDRTATGAIDPLTVTLNFSSGTEELSALTDTSSTLAAVYQDGSPIGTLSSFSIGQDGTISGSFTNGLTRSLGMVALATFTNPEGLVDAGNNLYQAGPNSGLAVDVQPQTFGSARVISGALELSNVDLSAEFVNLINTTTGFSASSRVITTSDELIQQLLAIAR
ncbi:flagellar hook-basal body complex protein [Planctomycetales bacterium ZRK34]|nr:flagellar hook-basal body complex protein [Planctomycetales bacterium ZRK34]